tara:strand:- start:43 stop:669 length:627 start_codon:yes stop_codon:yes gene_type:complete
MINIQTLEIFGDEVFTFKMPNHDKWEKQLKEIVKVEDNKNLHNFTTEPDDECNVKAKRTAWDSHLRYPTIRDLSTELIKIVLNLIDQQNFDAPNIEVTESWINWYKKNNFATPHSHGPNHLSIVYFVDVEKSNAQFCFHKKTSWSLIKKKDNNNSFTNFAKIITVGNGDVLMFPSSSIHSVSANLTDNLRITHACNLKVQYEKERQSY